MPEHRMNAYLLDEEKAALDKLMEDFALSGSGILRLGLRLLAGLPIPPSHRNTIEERISDRTHTTRNEERVTI